MADRERPSSQNMTEKEFTTFLDRNGQFHQRVAGHLAQLTAYPERRFDLALKSVLLSAEHGAGAFVLVSGGRHVSGYTLLRPQFETLVRGIWLMHAASDTWIEKLSRPLNNETAEAAKDTLMVAEMLKGLRKSETAPPGCWTRSRPAGT
jgi:hypothetical protein